MVKTLAVLLFLFLPLLALGNMSKLTVSSLILAVVLYLVLGLFGLSLLTFYPTEL